MATRMQQRRGTASQWSTANPILNAGEMGWESDTNKFKIGDGTNHWADLDYFIDQSSTVNPSFGTSIIFEGATADSYETTLQVTDPTADRTITFPDATGTVALTSDIEELSQDAIDTALTAGTGITKTYNDGANTLTIAVDTTAIQARVADVSDTEIGYLNGVTSAIQTQLDDKSTASKTETLTNKSISLGSNTVTSTLSQLNTAVSDADVASLAGTETLTNKTLTSPKINEDVIMSATATELNVLDGITSSTAELNILDGVTADYAELNILDGATLSTTELNYVDGVTSAIQTQIDAKAPTANASFTGTFSAPEGTITSTMIADGTIVNADINASAEIAQSKIANLTTDLGLKAPLADPTFTGTISAASLTLSGDLTVNGTTTNINSTSLVVEDKNIVLGDTAEPADNTADGGGITLKGTTDKTFNWVDATDAWTSSEHINLSSGKSLYLNGTLLKDVSETLTNKTLTTPVISSISNTGTLTLPTDTDTLVGRATTDTLTNKTLESALATTAFTLNATAELRLADTDSSHYVGFKAPGTVSANKIWTLPAADGDAGQVLTTDGSGTFSFSTPAAGAAFSELMLIGA